MKKIKLSQGGKYAGQFVALVDDEDYEVLNQYRWSIMRSGDHIYAVRSTTVNGKHKNVFMHREIMDVPVGFEIDHDKGNGLDNRKKNLRLATHSQNMHHAKNRKSKTGYRGVTQTGWNSYTALLTVDHQTIRLGIYPTPQEAAKAYDAKARELFGQFAVTNFRA